MSAIKYRSSVNDAWQDLQVVVGPQGPAGATGPVGATGATGATGNGIASIVLNNDYTLTITYTDGTSTTTGSIRGPQGEQGPAGSGGSSLTAGTGIDITNDVISATIKGYRKEYQPPWMLLFGALFTGGVAVSTVSTVDEALDILSNRGSIYYSSFSGSLVLPQPSLYQMGFTYYYTKNASNDFVRNSMSRSSGNITMSYNISIYALNNSIIIGSRDEIKNYLLKSLGYDNTNSGLVATTIKGAIDELALKTTGLSTVATSGDYDDLINKPTIPTVPTNVSSFTNDAGYLTTHQSLTGYATETYVNQAVGAIPTYSAGTGISINNGVISLNITNANGVSY